MSTEKNVHSINFLDRLRTAQTHSGLNQRQLAIAAGITPAYMSEILAGKKKPSERIVRLLSAATCVSRHWLETGEGDMRPAGVKEEPVLFLTETQKRVIDQMAHDPLVTEMLNAYFRLPRSQKLAQIGAMLAVLEELGDSEGTDQ